MFSPDASGGGPIGEIAEAVSRGRRLPTQVIVGRWQSLDWLLSLGSVLAKGASILIVAASAAEVEHIASQAETAFADHLVSVAGQDDASLTSAWARAQVGGVLVVGTPRTATWHIGHLGMVIVLEEARRAMKDRQTPTLHVRDVVRSRSLLEGITAIFFGPTPSVEVLSTGAETRRLGTRAWPLVEVIDRSNEGPGSGMLDSRVIKAIVATSERHQPTFVLGSAATVDRLGQELYAKVGSQRIGSSLVTVGTERDLAGLAPMGLVVAANPDGTLLSRGYRTSEEVLRVLARLGNSLGSGPRHRMMVQTTDATSMLVQTLRRGDPIPYLEQVLLERARAGLPPSVDLIAVELRGEIPQHAGQELAAMVGVNVTGPLEIEAGKRWLLGGRLDKARAELRNLVAKWRDAGATVRIDADPIDI